MELGLLKEKVMEILNITNVQDMPERLAVLVLQNEFSVYDKLVETIGNLSIDWIQKIFQYYMADRKEKMQDYTPVSLARLAGRLTETENESSVCDMCAGSGALTIQKWNLNHSLDFVCYEYDGKVIPLLLLNLAMRNIKALVVHGDVLQDEVFTRYTVQPGEKYGTVTEIRDKVYFQTPNSCISNPPYNVKWKLPLFAQIQPRFFETELPPESNANYAFVLSALHFASDKAVLILPNAVLSTENRQEKEIRKYLVEKNFVEAIISCPDEMFESTSISVCIVVLSKNKQTSHISFLDMRQTYEVESREQNGQFGGASHENRTYKKDVKVFSDEQIKKAIDSIEQQLSIPDFSKSVTIKTVSENDYSLIPSTYIDFQEKEFKHRKYSEIVADINRVTDEKNACKLTMNETLAKSLGFEVDLYRKDQSDSELNALLKKVGAEPLIKQNYFAVSKNKNEFKFENNSKDTLSSVLFMVLSTWKQHIFYLNQEENRYLAELRDALLPELMSGKIEIPLDNPLKVRYDFHIKMKEVRIW